MYYLTLMLEANNCFSKLLKQKLPKLSMLSTSNSSEVGNADFQQIKHRESRKQGSANM